MRPRVLTCDPQTTMVTVAQRMASEHVQVVVLRETVDAKGAVGRRPWGIISDRDVLHCADVIEDRCRRCRHGRRAARAPRRSAATSPSACSTSTSHAVVVQPRTDRPVGVLSTLDIAGILGWGRG